MTPPEASDVAGRIAVKHGMEGATITAIEGVGFVNHVFVARASDSVWVVRFALDPLSTSEYEAEAWAMTAAGRAGLPVAGVVAHGALDRVPYLVQEYVAPQGSLTAPWTVLGRFARDVASIPIDSEAPTDLFSRFGLDLAAAWHAHLAYGFEALVDDPLVAAGVYPAKLAPHIRSDISHLMDLPLEFGLAHGDLAPRNLIPQGQRRPVLIDWGATATGPAPWVDCLKVYEWALAGQDAEHSDFVEFVTAAGLEPSAATATLERMLVVQHLDLVRWAAAQRHDLFEQYRTSATEGIAASYRRR